MESRSQYQPWPKAAISDHQAIQQPDGEKVAGGFHLPRQPQTIHFDDQPLGGLPQGWTSAMTHTGGAPKWEIFKEATAPSPPCVLGQTSTDRTGGRFPLAIYDKVRLANGMVSVRFKPISGETGQAAGIVWRYENPANYYIVRANALEDNGVLYIVQTGKRISLAPIGTDASTYGIKQRVPSKTWSELAVSFQGSRFKVKLFCNYSGPFWLLTIMGKGLPSFDKEGMPGSDSGPRQGVVGIRAGLPIGSFSRPPRPRLRLGHPSSSEEGSSNPPAPKVPSSCVIFNGKQLFEVEDSTISAPGKVGLWTKADSVTCFDDFKVESH